MIFWSVLQRGKPHGSKRAEIGLGHEDTHTRAADGRCSNLMILSRPCLIAAIGQLLIVQVQCSPARLPSVFQERTERVAAANADTTLAAMLSHKLQLRCTGCSSAQVVTSGESGESCRNGWSQSKKRTTYQRHFANAAASQSWQAQDDGQAT